MASAATKERAHQKMADSQPLPHPAKRVLGAGKAFASLPSPEELERIDREWKREATEKRFGSAAE